MKEVVLYTIEVKGGDRLATLLDEDSFLPVEEDVTLFDEHTFYHSWYECSQVGFNGMTYDGREDVSIIAWVDEHIEDGRLNTQIMSRDESHSDELYSKVENSTPMLKDLQNILMLKIYDNRD